MTRNLTTGYYVPTLSFKEITEHVAVMDADDNTLIALVGPADDDLDNLQETNETAAVFAAAFDMLEALESIVKYDDNTLPWNERDIPAWIIDAAKAAIKKAREIS